MPGHTNHNGLALRPKDIFQGSLCRGAAILDEGMASRFSTIIDKPVTVFPETTDQRMPGQAAGRVLEERLKRFADGRPVVGLFGHLRKSKGVLPLLLASRHPKMSDVCFAFGGEMVWGSFTSNESQIVRDILTNGANTWNHLLRIPDEEQLNSVLSACDILYLGYLDFPHSSGLMTKAALLHKPLIVSDGYLMAERVRRFKLGEVVPQGDVDALVDGITKITCNTKAWVAENQPRWSDYGCEHSFERLKEAFREIFNRL